jgi:hypothetical protein
MKRASVLLLLGAAAIVVLPTCRSTEHTVARIVAPTPGPIEAEPPTTTAEPAAPRATAAPAVPPATRTPTPASMPVVTVEPGSRSDRSPGVLYEELVPTARAFTPQPTRTATRAITPLPTRTPTRAVTPLPTRTATRAVTPLPTRTPGRSPAGPGGAYYEDEQGRPVTSPTP